MPFFIRKGDKTKGVRKTSKKNSNKSSSKSNVSVSSKRPPIGGSTNNFGDEEIDSDEADCLDNVAQDGQKRPASDSESDHETAQDKRLRVAKLYLEEIKKQEEEVGGDVDARLRDDVLLKAGRLQRPLADRLSHCDSQKTVRLRCRQQRLCVTCVAVTSDQTFLFTASKDGCIVKWSLETNSRSAVVMPVSAKHSDKTTSSLQGHSASVLCITLSSDDKYLVSGDMAFLIHVRNSCDLSRVHVFRGHRGAVTGVVFQQGTHQLFSVSTDRVVKVWSVDDCAYIESLFGHVDAIGGVDALSRERAVTCGCNDNSVRVWKLLDESQLVYSGRGHNICCVKLINENHFITGGEDGMLSVWSAGKKRPLVSVSEAHGRDAASCTARWICSLATLLNSDVVASGSYDDCARVWRCCDNFGALQPLFVVAAPGFVNALHVSADRLVVCCGQEHRLGRWWSRNEVSNITLIFPLQLSETA